VNDLHIRIGGIHAPKPQVHHHLPGFVAVSADADAVKNRDFIAKRMTPQQIAQAQQMARDCQQRNFKGCE